MDLSSSRSAWVRKGSFRAMPTIPGPTFHSTVASSCKAPVQAPPHGACHTGSLLVTPLRLGRQRCVIPAASKGAAGATKPSTSGLAAGNVVEIRKDGAWDKPVLALVEGPDGKKNFWCVDHMGRRFSVVPKQASYVVSSSSAGGKAFTNADVASLFNDAKDADTSLLQINAKGNTACMYEPRPVDEVEAVKGQLEEETKVLKEEQDFKAAVKASFACTTRATQPDKASWLAGPHAARILALRAFVLGRGEAEASVRNLAVQSLKTVGITKDALPDAEEFLTNLGVFREHEPLSVLRMGCVSGAEHEPEVEAMLESPPPDPDAERRLDLTHLKVYTIDDKGTTEVDDGLSVELLPGASGSNIGRPRPSQPRPKHQAKAKPAKAKPKDLITSESGQGQASPGPSIRPRPSQPRPSQRTSSPQHQAKASYRLWIHVADPTRYFRADDSLDKAARKRTRTLYLPFGNVPMFPRSLAEGPFSLRTETVSEALSVGVVLDPNGYATDNIQVATTRIKVTDQLTYTEVDAKLAEPSSLSIELAILHKAAMSNGTTEQRNQRSTKEPDQPNHRTTEQRQHAEARKHRTTEPTNKTRNHQGTKAQNHPNHRTQPPNNGTQPDKGKNQARKHRTTNRPNNRNNTETPKQESTEAAKPTEPPNHRNHTEQQRENSGRCVDALRSTFLSLRSMFHMR
eukprot:gene6160-2772_t